jgi:chaperonin GroEL (HSP60 family)
MFKAGIIDPTRVVRIALQKTASMSGFMITAEAVLRGDCAVTARRR